MSRTLIRGKDTMNGVKIRFRDGEVTDYLEVPFMNFFYVKRQDYNERADVFQRVERFIARIEDSVEQDKIKLILSNNWKRNDVRKTIEENGIETFEADMMAYKRWLIENPEIELNSLGLKWFMYDLETDDRGAFMKDERGNIIATAPILTCAFIDQEGNEHFAWNQDKENIIEGEKKLLLEIKAIFEEFDINLAWNGKRFDDNYLKQRNDFHGISNQHFDFINQMDYMEMVKKNYKGLDSYSLDGVSEEILDDRQKLPMQDKGNGGIYKTWLKLLDGSDDILKRYNLEDVKLMFEIEAELKFIPLHMTQSNLCHCYVQETLHNTKMVDQALANEFLELGIVMPSEPNETEVAENAELGGIGGAYTFCRKPGFHKDLLVYDFKSYYATTMAHYNICWTTIGSKEYFEENGIPYCTVPEDRWEEKGSYHPPRYYRTDKKGIIASMAEKWITERDKIKYAMEEFKISNPNKYRQMYLHQYALKTMANSMYGAMAFSRFRFYNYNLADSITTACRVLTKKCIIYAEERNFVVVQGDTDSIIFKQGPGCTMTPKDLEIAFEDMFDDYAKEVGMVFDFNIKAAAGGRRDAKHFIVFEHEKTYQTMIAVKKKNYASLMIIKDKKTGELVKKIDIKGLECKKKDTNPLAKKLQKNLIVSILKEEFDKTEFIKEIQTLREIVESNALNPEELIMKKSLSKPTGDYDGYIIDKNTGKPKVKKDGTLQRKTLLPHVRIAMQMEAEGKEVFPGDQISYIVKNRVPKIEPITLDEFKEERIYDHAYYWERITKALLKVLSAVDKPLALDNAMLFYLQDKYTKTGRERKALTLELAMKKLTKHMEKIVKATDDEGIVEYHGEKFLKND